MGLPTPIRVALFTDAYEEPNGVATLSREFAGYAQSRGLPMMVVRGGRNGEYSTVGSLTTLVLERGRFSFKLDQDLYCDPVFIRHKSRARAAIEDFAPDLIHITGPGDMGIFGARLAHLCRIPLVASWHTNLHEYAARRIRKSLSRLPSSVVSPMAQIAEQYSLKALLRFYKLAHLSMAPNLELVNLIADSTGRPCAGMLHGVDLDRFRPSHRQRSNDVFSIGYVGRLTVEKNVQRLVDIDRQLKLRGARSFRFTIIGDGSEHNWLSQQLPDAHLTGVLRGDALAEAMAGLDAFVFPSETDTFGLVVLEAMASGVPVIVACGGGPQYQVRHGVDGFVAENTNQFVEAILMLQREPKTLEDMRLEAWRHACESSWSQVFDQVHATYRSHLFSS
ncbi:MAG: glycosyltransferase family 1 protein [Acidobacteria bacterium]|nr:glycosyltransferase family 1 protein [Acidobacteriota bacterium]